MEKLSIQNRKICENFGFAKIVVFSVDYFHFHQKL